MLAGTSVAYGHHVDHRSEVTEVIILQIARDITFGHGGDARWPFARQRAGEMAVRQAPDQRDGRLPGKGPPPKRLWPSSCQELGQSRLGGGQNVVQSFCQSSEEAPAGAISMLISM